MLVTDVQGNESVREIKNDLGVTSAGWADNLRAQGYQGAIDARGGVGDDSAPQAPLANAFAARPSTVPVAGAGAGSPGMSRTYQSGSWWG